MTKKLFINFSMLLFVLAMSTNVAWGNHLTDMTDEQAETMGFWARLTAKPATATNGSGKVFVSEDYHEVTPSDEDYVSSHSVDGWSDVYAQTSLINGDVSFSTYAKADPGSYFTGWSFTDGSTDLGDQMSDFGVEVTPSSKKGHSNIREYIIYAAFNKVQIASYEFVSGSNTTTHVGDDWTCTQTIRFRVQTPNSSGVSSLADVTKHIKLPVVTRKAGTTGVWSTSVVEWTGANASAYGEYAELLVPVTFVAPNGNAGEYAAELVLETYAGVKMKVYLYARTTGATGEATRYNSAKEPQEAGNLATLLTNAVAGDIIKLNGNYSSAVNLNKNITFDLNGFTLNSTLTVSGGNVTIAYSPYGGSANALKVTGGKAILNGGTFGALTIGASGTVEQNGATITGAATNNGSLKTTDGKFEKGLTSSKTLVVNGGSFFNNEDDYVAIKVTDGTAQINRGVISADYGVKTTNGGEAIIEKLADFSGCNSHYALQNDGGSIIVNNGKFYDPVNLAEGEITFNAGYFQYNGSGESTVLGKQVWRNTAGPEFRAGYNFFAGSQDAAQASNVSVCRIGQTAYASLEDALAYAENNPDKSALIFMENDYTLKAGYYTVPANATLVVPMSNDQDVANPVVPRANDSYTIPYKFRRLTLESGVEMNVLGTIELTCVQNSQSGSEMSYPNGPYGHLMMKPGSHITLSDGAELRAWGYVTGDGSKDGAGNYLSGEIDARRGSTVREQFQMGDWKGGNYSLGIISDELLHNRAHLFPIYEYFIQNIESPVKYHPGSSLITATSVFVEYANAYANDIKVVGKEGEPAMFLMDEMADADNTWVRKFYDAKKDQQVYEVNSGAQLGSLLIELGSLMGMELSLNSAKFVLPLTSNFKIHLLSGSMQFTQSTSCLPGMEVEVDKEAEVSIIKNSDPTIVSGALYFYDSDQWGQYVYNKRYGAIVQYSATWALDPDKGGVVRPNVRSVASAAALGDAKLIVHGTFRCAENCAVYTTAENDYSKLQIDLNSGIFHVEPVENTGGACITSTNEDAGTFIFDAPAPMFVTNPILDYEFNLSPNILFHFDNVNGLEAISGLSVLNKATGMNLGGAGTNQQIKTYSFQPCTSARLKNGAGAEHEFAETAGTEGGKSYCYMNNQWTLMDVASENDCFMKDNYGTFYAKPAEYVAVNATWDGEKMVGNADHTYSDKAGAGRLFILMDDCQWWEVEKKDNLYHCIHPNNDTYYYWDETEEKWMEQRFTITWKNYDGTPIEVVIDDAGLTGTSYSVTYGTQAEFLGSIPTHPADIDYTYTFTGWSPALGKVTSDVTYTATYEKQKRKYTIIFQNEGGDEIERQFLTHNAMPKCENTPTCTGFTLQWEPEVAAVVGDATYRATWLENPPTEYQVTFFDYNGTTVLKQGNVVVGAVPTPPTITDGIPAGSTGKPATPEFTYVFYHWSPALEAVSVEGPKSYTAVYREVAKTYEIKFYNETASSVLKTENLTYGATPTPPAVTKENPEAGHTYTLVWKNLDESANIENVTANASYKPTYLDVVNRYTVTLRCNIPGACTFTGAGTYDYNTSVTIAANPASGYEFVKWQERAGDANLGEQNITADISLTAVVKVKDTPLPGNLNLGIDATENDPAESYSDITITSDGISQSSQILNAGNITTLYGNADFRLVKSFAGSTWYCVAVPWRVDVNGGILLNGTTPAVLGKNIDICYYDGSVRAAQGKVDACWVYMRNLSTKKVLEPGRAYMIALKNGAASITFRKKVQEPLLTTNTSVTQYPSSTATDAGWNAIANPSLFHAYVNAGTTDKRGQRYLSESDTYDWFRLDEHQLVVGEPVYVQVPSDKSIVVAKGASYAPRRVQAAQPTSFDVNITAAGAAKYADHLSVSLNEDKEENTYVIGQDLVKFGVSSKVAQMWIDRYDAKLCVNTIAPEGDATNFPMSIFAPKAGDYTIAIEREVNTDDQALYLTYNGEAIWNLSDGAYVAHLNKGTDNKYGLRVSARAPQITTGIDEAVVDAKGETRKVLINDQVFIIRGEKVYSVDGQLVK